MFIERTKFKKNCYRLPAPAGLVVSNRAKKKKFKNILFKKREYFIKLVVVYPGLAGNIVLITQTKKNFKKILENIKFSKNENIFKIWS